MSQLVYVNGTYFPKEEATISVFDRGFLFGDGIYEVVPVVNGKLVDKANFWERLDRSLREIKLTWSCSKEEILEILETLIAKNELSEGGVYLQVTRGIAERDFAFPKDTPPSFMAFTFAKSFINHPKIAGVEVVSVEDIRWKRRDVKSISLLGQCLSKDEVVQKGAFEGWMVEDGFVTEGTSSTAYIVKDGTLITRPLSNDILPGIRRKVILEFCANEGIKVEERPFSIAEALKADEAFMSSATIVLLPIIKLDGQPIGTGKPGVITMKLRDKYVKALKEEAGL